MLINPFQLNFFPQLHLIPALSNPPFSSISSTKFRTRGRTTKIIRTETSFTAYFHRTVGAQCVEASDGHVNESGKSRTTKKRVFFLDVNPICYEGSTPSLRAFGRWVSLFFSEVSCTDPVIAVSYLFCFFMFILLLLSYRTVAVNCACAEK